MSEKFVAAQKTLNFWTMDVKDDKNDGDFLDKVLQICYGYSESDDEDEGRLTKANALQIKKIEDFNKEYHGPSISKKQFQELWSKLTCELNSLGPPTFTELQWSLKSLRHSQNKERMEVVVPPQQEQQSRDFLSPVQNIELSTHGTANSPIEDKLDVIIEKVDAILKAFERLINLLQESK